jgi:hypothetical protein
MRTHSILDNRFLHKKWPRNEANLENDVYESPTLVNIRKLDKLVLGVTITKEMEE